MAAFEPPWLVQMTSPKRPRGGPDADGGFGPATPDDIASPLINPPPTYAAFSPVTLSSNPSAKSSSKRRSTILVHQKSPLLLATPPQITRALAYSHPFLLPLNKFAGLLTWTTGDPWESFVMLLVFWAVVLYGDVVIRMAGPIVVVAALILGMYARRFSPLSTSGWSEPAQKDSSARGVSGAAAAAAAGRLQKNGGKPPAANGAAKPGHRRGNSEVTNTRHQKTLDEIVETIKEFTSRCNMLLEPMIEMTDFLSTQRTPTSATTRPALTTMFIRILFCTPFWVALTLPPLRIITTRRVVLVFGTLILSWHAKFMRVAREVLWRSSMIRKVAALLTGLTFECPMRPTPVSFAPAASSASEAAENNNLSRTASTKRRESELTKALRQQSHHHGHKHGGPGDAGVGKDAGVKFTFIIYENQRRWVGLGWTTSLFAYERSAWTDEHNNPVPARDSFELPETEEGSHMHWRWVSGSKWKVDGVPDDGKEVVDYDGPEGNNGWVYYDNKWQNGRRGLDGWGRWTRRRKWYRDAELVEIGDDEEQEEEQNSGVTTAAAEGEAPAQPKVASNGPPTSLITTPPRIQAYSTIGERMESPTMSNFGKAIPTLAPVQETDGATDDCDDYEANTTAVSSNNNNTHANGVPIVGNGNSKGADEKDSYDSSSLHSTSSRSFFRPTSLRRKLTDRSSATMGSSSGSVPAGTPGSQDTDKERIQRSRGASEARSEVEVAGLGVAAAMSIQDQDHGLSKGSWGIGDEARMSLE